MPSLFDYLGYAGNALDLPASSLRDLLTGNNPFDQWATPFSDRNRATGRDVLSPFLGANEETGFAGWADNPMEGLKDLAGFGAEMLLDPLNLVSGAGVVKVLRGAKAAKGRNAVAAAENAANAGKYGYVNSKAAARVVNPMTGEAPQKLLGYSPEPERMFHGGRDWTPSATPDKPYGMFDASRLRSGEGGQAYGPGMYLSDSPDVTRHYKELVQSRLKSEDPVTDAFQSMSYWSRGEPVKGASQPELINEFLTTMQDNNWLGFNPRTLTGRDKMKDMLYDRAGVPDDVLAAYDKLESVTPKARVYELDVPPGTKDRFMRWEEDFGGQPASVQNVIAENPIVKLLDEYHGIRSKTKDLWRRASAGEDVTGEYDAAWDALDTIQERLTAAAGDPSRARRLTKEDPLLHGQDMFELLTGSEPSSTRLTAAAPVAQAGIPGMSNPAAIVKGARNYAVWDMNLIDQMRVRGVDGQRVPINPTTLVQQIAQPLPRAADPTLVSTSNPMRQMERVPSALAPAAGMAVQNILARQQGPGGIQ
jgi:hypothetical protein